MSYLFSCGIFPCLCIINSYISVAPTQLIKGLLSFIKDLPVKLAIKAEAEKLNIFTAQKSLVPCIRLYAGTMID